MVILEFTRLVRHFPMKPDLAHQIGQAILGAADAAGGGKPRILTVDRVEAKFDQMAVRLQHVIRSGVEHKKPWLKIGRECAEICAKEFT